MKILNQSVIHKAIINSKGEGIIIDQDEKNIIVKFAKETISFPFPLSFEKFLKFKDAELQAEVEALIVEFKEREAHQKAEEREAKLRAAEEAKRAEEERIAAEKHKTSPAAYERHADENNLAFKCNFCDGGCSPTCLGFKGVCSPEQIKYNIEKKRRAWCSDKKDSACYKYHTKAITREELEELNKDGKFVCYEAKMLVDWKAEAGEDRNGADGPRARRITGASKNSLAVLTTELPDIPDGKKRVIFGVFITGVVDEGDDIQAGYVKAKGDYHIELTPEESKKMMFWHYYKNPNSTEKIQWGTGLYRYMKDAACARILADIVNIKTVPAEKERAQKVLEHYCALKGIDVNNIPAADGAI